MKSTKKIICICCSLIIALSLTACSNGKKKSAISKYIANVNFTDFSKNISADRIYSTIEKLSAKDDARITDSEGEWNASQYISKQFNDIGLTVNQQSFPIQIFKCNNVEVNINLPKSKIIKSKALTFSKNTPKEGLSSEVVNGYMGSLDDLKKAKVKGKLVLIKRGSGEKFYAITQRAYELDAIGVIFFDPKKNDIISGTLLQPSQIPAVAISKADAENIISTIESSKNIKSTIKVDCEYKSTYSKNIIGTLKSNKNNAKTIVVGAHYDGVDTPAANDNASGVSTILEAARVLSKEKLDCNIKFIAFGAEEIGTVGSYYYARTLSDDDLKNTVAMINADMVGVGNKLCVNTMNSKSNTSIADLATSCMNQFKYDNKRDYSEASDHICFEMFNIPSVYIAYGPDENYHTDRDTIDKIKKENLSNTCNVIISLCNEISKNPEMFSN